MSDVAMLSPSKATDLMYYLRAYPLHPLRIDLLIDFLMHSQVLVPQPGVPIFTQRDVEGSRWQNAFQDLINAGAISFPPPDYMSKDEEVALLKVTLSAGADRDLINDPLDFGLTIRHALREQVPMKYRESDVELLRKGEHLLNEVYSQWGFRPEVDGALSAETEERSSIAKWIFRLQMPVTFARRDNTIERELGWPSGEAVWMDPAQLAALLKEREPIDQFRASVQRLAQRGYDELQTAAHVAKMKYALEKRLTIADFTFEAADFVIDALPIPFKKVAGNLLKRAVTHAEEQPYKWLLLTSKVDAKACKDAD